MLLDTFCPRFANTDSPDGRSREAVFFCDYLIRSVVIADSSNHCHVEHVMAAVAIAITIVLPWRAPVKVLSRVVGLVVITMQAQKTIGSWAYECLSDKLMHLAHLRSFATGIQIYRLITSISHNRFHHTVCANAPNPPQV